MTERAAEAMVDAFCIAEPRYINKEEIIKDITIKLRGTLRKFKENGYNFEDLDGIEFIKLATYEIQSILFVIRTDYIREDMALFFRIMHFITDFLKQNINKYNGLLSKLMVLMHNDNHKTSEVRRIIQNLIEMDPTGKFLDEIDPLF